MKIKGTDERSSDWTRKYVSHNMFQWNLDHLLQILLQPIRAARFLCYISPKVYMYSFPLTKVGVSIDIISLFKVWPRHNVWRTTTKSNNITFISFPFVFYNLEQVVWVKRLKMCACTMKHNNIFIVLGRCDGLCSMWDQISKWIWEGGINRYTGILD